MAPSLLVVDDGRVARMAAAGIVKRLRPGCAVIEAANAGAASA